MCNLIENYISQHGRFTIAVTPPHSTSGLYCDHPLHVKTQTSKIPSGLHHTSPLHTQWFESSIPNIPTSYLHLTLHLIYDASTVSQTLVLLTRRKLLSHQVSLIVRSVEIAYFTFVPSSALLYHVIGNTRTLFLQSRVGGTGIFQCLLVVTKDILWSLYWDTHNP